jgi:hypothetical protein
MSEPRAHETPEDADATLATPRFDEEETVLAQPVVPIDAEELPPTADPSVVAPAAYAQPRAARRQWPLALILLSALAGSILGGAGLYFVQKQRRADAAPPKAVQPQPSPTVEQAAEAAPPVKEPAEVVPPVEPPTEGPREETAKPQPVDDDDERATPPVAEAGTSRRGKKAEDEEDDRRGRPRRAERDDDNNPAPSSREARRVDSIVYPSAREERRAARRAQRRAERQAERRERRDARNVDRVRAIFEGQP